MKDENFRQWQQSPRARLLLQQEKRVVAAALEEVFGLHLLQVGAWGRAGAFFEGARTQRQALMDVEIAPTEARCGAVQARPAALPVPSDSVDAVLLPHTLEFEEDPYAVLREVSRVLVAEGKLLVLGFSPLGPWALRQRLAAQEQFPPGLKRMVSPRRLREWLRVLSLEVTHIQRYNQSHRFMPAGAYLLKAHKRIYTLTPIRLKRRESRGLVGGLVEPTT